MKIRLLISFILFLFFFHAKATHIVGGQLFITESQSSQYNYKIGLTMYFDALNGDPGAEDQFVNIFVFRKRDNAAIGYVQAPKIERKSVSYANPDCGISTLQTYMITYSIDVRLESGTFNDPGGYYMVWDRCCRNGTITNIKNPADAGSLFYLEFPPIVRNNAEFHNSSPVFPALTGDYACVNSPFLFNFGGTDADGDSLTYTLITPLQGVSNKITPGAEAVGSSSYPRLTWIDGISVNNVIPGSKPLTVDPKTGLLSVTPSNIGLYVFAVQVDEYRNKVKIGTVTRDFQLKVVDCPRMDAPKLMFKPLGSSTFYNGNEIITVNKDDPKCFEVMVTDPSIHQLVKVDGQTVNSPTSYFSILPAEFITKVANDTLRFQVCLDECFVSYDTRPIRIQLIAQDESCPVPLTDTLTIYIRRPDTQNNAPNVTTSMQEQYVHAAAGVPVSFTVFAKDMDKDSLLLSAAGQNFSFTAMGMKFPPVSGKAAVQQTFTWTPPCNAREGDTLTVNFTAQDVRCAGNPYPYTKPVYFIIDESPNRPPAVTTSLAENRSIVHNIGTTAGIVFDVIASDPDTNSISLTAKGRGFELGDYGMTFTDKNGKLTITSPYEWMPDCSMLNGETERIFTIDFITQDKACLAATDTTSVEVMLKNPESEEMPEIPNVITPNRDGKNDCFIFEDFPEDNCENQFIDVTVFNRWGKQVFYAKTRANNWCPSDISAGYYYYVIQYTKKSYKGGLTVIK